MLEVKCYKRDGSEAGTVSLPEGIFSSELRMGLIHQVVTAQLANRRQGNASTKTRAEVRGGGGAKPWRQKGTGRARASSIRSPIWVGGGVVFGPKPREYRKRIPKKMKLEALKSALAARLREGNLVVVDELDVPEIKTRHVAAMLRQLGLEGWSVLMVCGEYNRELYLSARNIPNVMLTYASALSALDVLRHRKVVIEKAALDILQQRVA